MSSRAAKNRRIRRSLARVAPTEHACSIHQLQLPSKCPLLQQLCRAGSKLRFGITQKLRIEPIPTPVVQAMLLDNASPMHEDCHGTILAPPTHLLRDVGSHFSAGRAIPRLPHLPPPPSTRQAPLPSTRNRRNIARPREMLRGGIVRSKYDTEI